MDVTSDSSVETAVGNALREAGNIDVLVNNAGIGVAGRQESFTPDDWKKVFEVNVFGVQRVSRALIPHFRERQSGTLINISSLLGRITLPYYGPYNASKWALEAMSENYRAELSQFGIDVALVEPGGFPTSFFGNLVYPSDADREKAYEAIEPSPQAMGEAFGETLQATPAQDPQLVADAILSLVNQEGDKPFRTPVDKLGMGEPLKGYNEGLEGITQGIFKNFGMPHLLQVKR
jgi:NAD(P)-dependent dehydrogenase (short-subunit alcohol dehydrogenase family)